MPSPLSLSVRAIAPLFMLLLATPLRAQSLQWDPVQDCAPEDAGHLRPRIAMNEDGDPVVLWSRSGDEGCFAAVREQAAFSAAMRLNPDGLSIAAADWQGPAIASAGGSVWAVFKAMPEDTAPCYLVESTDGGFTWGDTVRVDPYDGLVSRFPSVAVKEDGSPIVEYMQFTTGYLEPRHVVRTWMGSSFMPPAQISTPYAPGEVCDCCTGEVAASEDAVVALYRNAGSNIRTIWGAASTNGGMGFTTGAQVDDTGWWLAACPSSGPDLYLDGDSIRYVWMSGEGNGTKVFAGSAHAGSLAMGAQGNVHPDQLLAVQQNFPRIAGRGDTLGIVWEQSYLGQREILFAWSTTGLAGLSVPDTVNTELPGAQRAPDIAYADGAFHIVWSEPTTGQVRYRRAQVVDDTGIEGSGSKETIRIQYDAAADLVRVIGVDVRTVDLLDGTGRVLTTATGSAMSLSGTPPGCYFVQVITTEGVRRTARMVKPR